MVIGFILCHVEGISPVFFNDKSMSSGFCVCVLCYRFSWRMCAGFLVVLLLFSIWLLFFIIRRALAVCVADKLCSVSVA